MITNHANYLDCVAHSEGQFCCLDIKHPIGVQLREDLVLAIDSIRAGFLGVSPEAMDHILDAKGYIEKALRGIS